MEFLPDHEYYEFARCEAFNSSDSNINMAVTYKDLTTGNIKIGDIEGIEIGKVYLFHFKCIFNGTRNSYILSDYKDALECPLDENLFAILPIFYNYVPCGIEVLEKKLDYYISTINNKVLKDIVDAIMEKYRHEYLIYPAAIKVHHNYIGGLAYHSLTMCDLAAPMANVYENLDYDYLITGCILHDISKIVEFGTPTVTEYSAKGQLLGHLVLGAMEIERIAAKLGYEDSEEVMLLEHMIISHHGNPQFGACKKPETPEALILWILDTIDSKMRVIDDTYPKFDCGSFTDSIKALDGMKFYKKKN